MKIVFGLVYSALDTPLFQMWKTRNAQTPVTDLLFNLECMLSVLTGVTRGAVQF